MTIFVCEDSIEGIFTGIYDAWASKLGHANVELSITGLENMELFREYVPVKMDMEKAQKVTRTICDRMGMEVYEWICSALLSDNKERANAVYHTIVVGLQLRDGSKVMNHLTCSNVCKVFEYARSARREAHHYTGFLRFNELFNHVLFSKINPKNNILTILAPHFADRLPLENWIIYDERRGIFAVHECRKQWAIVLGAHINNKRINNFSENEKEFQKLWKGFCESISVNERKDYLLQRQNLPLRYRSNMVEFAE
jgi:probable DNA metabolism protein